MPPTKSGRREVRIVPELVAELKAYREAGSGEGLARAAHAVGARVFGRPQLRAIDGAGGRCHAVRQRLDDGRREDRNWLILLVPRVGLEPTTNGLTGQST